MFRSFYIWCNVFKLDAASLIFEKDGGSFLKKKKKIIIKKEKKRKKDKNLSPEVAANEERS